MIHVTLTNEMLARILSIEASKNGFAGTSTPRSISSRLRKLSKKRSAYSSNRIEGNPLTEREVDAAIESRRRHFLKPEEEVRNYYRALEFLDKAQENGEPLSKALLLKVQAMVVEGESREKAGIRQAMPPGVLFAVWDAKTGKPEYIPPDAEDIDGLLDELFAYLETSDDHPLLKAGIIHYQLVTIHPFEDGNGRTARILSSYYLGLSGYGFGGMGSLEEYFAWDADEYYRSLQMGLPALYYSGRDDPPHPEIWMEYFLKMVDLYAKRVNTLVDEAIRDDEAARLTHLGARERAFLDHLREHGIEEFRPTDMAGVFDVTNRTIINWSAKLAANGYLEPVLVKQRVTRYRVVGE